MAAGAVWALTQFLVLATGLLPGDEASVLAFFVYAVYGVLGFFLLIIPLVIGLSASTLETRLAAAYVGSGIAVLAGIFWLLVAAYADQGIAYTAVLLAQALVFFVPLALTVRASRARSGGAAAKR